jgi:AraC family transcriptional activator FtrA
VVDDVLYVGSDGIMTSAGSAAGIDLCLHLVREDFGVEAANPSPDGWWSLPSRRRAGAAVVRPVAQARESQRLGLVFDFCIRISPLATPWPRWRKERAWGSARFTPFQAATGKTPARWLLDERLQRASSI